MKAAAIELLVGILLLLGGALFFGWLGYTIADNRTARKTAALAASNYTLSGQLSLAQSVNQGNAGQLTSLRKKLAAERAVREQAAAAAAAELAARADRIAALERNATQRIQTITQKANHDEDCAPLRALPVCPAVAERLWGDPAATGTH